MVEFGERKDMAITDPVCGKTLTLDQVVAHEEHNGWAYFFCSHDCHKTFLAEPKRFVSNEVHLASKQGRGRP